MGSMVSVALSSVVVAPLCFLFAMLVGERGSGRTGFIVAGVLAVFGAQLIKRPAIVKIFLIEAGILLLFFLVRKIGYSMSSQALGHQFDPLAGILKPLAQVAICVMIGIISSEVVARYLPSASNDSQAMAFEAFGFITFVFGGLALGVFILFPLWLIFGPAGGPFGLTGWGVFFMRLMISAALGSAASIVAAMTLNKR